LVASGIDGKDVGRISEASETGGVGKMTTVDSTAVGPLGPVYVNVKLVVMPPKPSRASSGEIVESEGDPESSGWPGKDDCVG
jgi:hypothetical protein